MELKLDNGIYTALVTTKGGELISLKKGNTEYIWGGDASWWSGRNPILFPIVGNLKGGVTRFGDRDFPMNRHGFARNLEWTAAEQRADSVTLELCAGEETRSRYPFDFSLRVTHALLEDGFSTTFAVKNCGETAMPFCIGAHTAFNCPLVAEESFEDYELVFDREETAHTLKLTADGLISQTEGELMLAHTDRLPLSYEPFARMDTLAFAGLRSGKVALRSRKSGVGVELEFSQFPLVAFWTKPGAPFLCLEPWQGHADSETASGQFMDKSYIVSLNAGETKELTYKIRTL